MSDTRPEEIAQTTAVSNATSTGEQPAILANLALVQQIFNQNLQQQLALSQQQAMNQLQLATVAKCVSLIAHADGTMSQAQFQQMLQDIQAFLRELDVLKSKTLSQVAAYPEDLVASADIGHLKAMSEQPSALSDLAFSNLIANVNLSQQNAIANQQAMNELGISIVGKTVNTITNLGPLEARSAVDILSSNELAQTIADLKATLEAFKR